MIDPTQSTDSLASWAAPAIASAGVARAGKRGPRPPAGRRARSQSARPRPQDLPCPERYAVHGGLGHANIAGPWCSSPSSDRVTACSRALVGGNLTGLADRDRDHDEQRDHACDDHYQDNPRAHAQLRWLRRRVGHRQLVPPFAHPAGRLARPELRHEPVDRAAAQRASAQRAALVPAFACQMQGGRGAGSCVSADAQRISEHLGYLHSHVVPPFKRNRTGSYSRVSRLGCHRRLDRGVHLGSCSPDHRVSA